MTNIHPEPEISIATSAERLHEIFVEAVGLHQKGELDRARDIYESILRIHPAHPDVLHLLGVVSAQCKDFDRAQHLIGQANAVQPHNQAFHANRGNVLLELKRFDDAIGCYDEALRIKPDYAEAHRNRAVALQALRRFDEALAGYDHAIELKPLDVDAHYHRGNVLRDLNRPEVALASYDTALRMNPRLAEAFSNKAAVLLGLKRWDDVLANCDAALNLMPRFAEPLVNRGTALHRLRRHKAALTDFDEAICLRADYAEAYANRGNLLRGMRRLDQAIDSYDRAIAIRNDFADALFGKALALLQCGRYAEGWRLYESRWNLQSAGVMKRDFSAPLWLGEENIEGRTILLHCEQGLGDAIQFSRYAAHVTAQGARVVLEAPASLVRIFQSLAGVSAVIAQGAAPPLYEVHCPVMSLPLALSNTLAGIPHAAAYLKTEPASIARWAKKLGPKTSKRIGIVWSGNPGHQNDQQRSIPLAQWMPHLSPHFEYISLQKDVGDADRATLVDSSIRYFGGELADFMDTAALCELVDVVVSVDTSVAHLGGALGTPTWVLLPYESDWRWQLDRNDSPWYPSVTVYRNDCADDWRTTLAQVHQDLLKLQ